MIKYAAFILLHAVTAAVRDFARVIRIIHARRCTADIMQTHSQRCKMASRN